MPPSPASRVPSLSLLCLAAALTASPPLAAQAPTPAFDSDSDPGIEAAPDLLTSAETFKPVSLTLFFENDGTFVRPNRGSDRHYTSGQGFHLASPLDPVTDTDDSRRSLNRDAIGFVLVQQIYAPEDITDPNPPPDDRPYAGYLYGGLFYQRQSYNPDGIDTLDHVQLDLGVVGPSSLAEQSQSEVHCRSVSRTRRARTPTR